jgi:hypothetical protein
VAGFRSVCKQQTPCTCQPVVLGCVSGNDCQIRLNKESTSSSETTLNSLCKAVNACPSSHDSLEDQLFQKLLCHHRILIRILHSQHAAELVDHRDQAQQQPRARCSACHSMAALIVRCWYLRQVVQCQRPHDDDRPHAVLQLARTHPRDSSRFRKAISVSMH